MDERAVVDRYEGCNTIAEVLRRYASELKYLSDCQAHTSTVLPMERYGENERAAEKRIRQLILEEMIMRRSDRVSR